MYSHMESFWLADQYVEAWHSEVGLMRQSPVMVCCRSWRRARRERARISEVLDWALATTEGKKRREKQGMEI